MENIFSDIAESITSSEAAERVGQHLAELGASVIGPLGVAGIAYTGLKIIFRALDE